MDAISTWLLAFALLTADSTKPPADAAALREEFPALRQPLTKLALDMQILDPRETRFVVRNAADLDVDLPFLQRRARLLRDAPRIVESERFPPRAAVNELLVKNRERRKTLDEMKPKNEAEVAALRKEVAELDRLYRIWDAIRDARNQYYYVSVHRQALAQLKDLLGDADFAAAKLPPAVP